MDRRKLARIFFIADAEIFHDNGIMEGEIDNLSLGGVFVKTHGNIALNSKVNIIMYLAGTGQKPPIKIQGTVNRNSDRGIAIKFINDSDLNKKLSNAFL